MIERRGGWRLAAMMALVYAVQGSFWPLLAVHLQDLGLNGRSRGWIFATLAMGSVIVPLGAGQLVDRLMRTQRCPGACLCAGGGPAGPTGQRFGDSARLAVPAVSVFLDDHRPDLRAVQLAGHAAPGRPWTPVRRDPTVGNDRLDGRWLVGLGGDGLDRGKPDRAGVLTRHF